MWCSPVRASHQRGRTQPHHRRAQAGSRLRAVLRSHRRSRRAAAWTPPSTPVRSKSPQRTPRSRHATATASAVCHCHYLCLCLRHHHCHCHCHCHCRHRPGAAAEPSSGRAARSAAQQADTACAGVSVQRLRVRRARRASASAGASTASVRRELRRVSPSMTPAYRDPLALRVTIEHCNDLHNCCFTSTPSFAEIDSKGRAKRVLLTVTGGECTRRFRAEIRLTSMSARPSTVSSLIFERFVLA